MGYFVAKTPSRRAARYCLLKLPLCCFTAKTWHLGASCWQWVAITVYPCAFPGQKQWLGSGPTALGLRLLLGGTSLGRLSSGLPVLLRGQPLPAAPVPTLQKASGPQLQPSASSPLPTCSPAWLTDSLSTGEAGSSLP